MNSSNTLNYLLDGWWNEVCSHVHGCLVFMDDAAAESLHWHGGLNRILESGAEGVKNLSIFEKASPMHKKAVFVITSPIAENIWRTLMMIIRSNTFLSCTIVTCLSESCHDIGVPDVNKTFVALERRVRSWMGNSTLSAKVLYVPVFAACLLPELFIIPSLAEYFLPVSTEFQLQDAIKNSSESGLKALPEVMQTSIKMLTCYLNALLEGLQLKGDIFSLGSLSHIVGTELENLCHVQRKKVFTAKASVLLMDRSLDLAGPLSQVVESPFGKMLRVMPHLSGHVCDVSVCMEDIASCKTDTVFGFPLLAPGCIAHKGTATEADVLKTILTSRVKEAVMEVNKKVIQLGGAEGLTFDSGSGSALKFLRKRISSYRENSALLTKHCGLLQQALSIVQAIEHPTSGNLDDLLATEKLLVQNFALSKHGVGEDIARLIANRKERNYKMADVLMLIAFLYALSIVDVCDVESEASIQATIMEALFQEDEDTAKLVRKLAGDDADDQDIMTAVKTFFHVVKKLKDSRSNLKKFRSLFDSGDPALPATYVSLLKQVLENIFNSSDILDMEFHSAGLRDYIKTGFSLFMNVARPQPRDNATIIIFVLGGITAAEIKAVQDFAARHKKTKILLGSTSLLTPENVMTDLFNVVRNMSTSSEEVEDL